MAKYLKFYLEYEVHIPLDALGIDEAEEALLTAMGLSDLQGWIESDTERFSKESVKTENLKNYWITWPEIVEDGPLDLFVHEVSPTPGADSEIDLSKVQQLLGRAAVRRKFRGLEPRGNQDDSSL